MNNIIQHLHDHRSIRKFKEKSISNSTLKLILEAATTASTSGNMQAYSIIISKDLDIKKKMLEAHFNQPMLLEAPVFLTFCADFNRMRKWVSASQAANNFDNYMSFMIASIDAILASQNAAIAAESLGLGICYMGTTLASAKEIGKVLKLPKHVVPVVGYALGYPDEMPEARKRLPLEGIIHHEYYSDYTDDDVLDIYRDKNSEGMRRYSEFKEVENLAQVYTQLKYTEESHIGYSENLLEYLKEQGFLHAP
jgi:nitroreductase